ncbi:MATE family efflux transporter [Candidatus Dependentiae bacterium]
MKKGLIASYWDGIRDTSNGESYGRIFRYFFPEFITALILYSLLYLLDAYFIADLKSTSTYATLGITNTILHFIVKFAEGISVGTIVLGGRFNGADQFKKVGKTLTDAFWIATLVGLVISSILFFGAYWIYYFYGVPHEMIHLGVPFLRLRAIGIFFMFLYFAFIGFMRGVKNTKTPMKIFAAGAVVFILFDYVLIFGKFGFPKMGLQGSAAASVIQYGVMLLLAVVAIFFREKNRKYAIHLFEPFRSVSRVVELVKLSIPVIIDKSTIALAYIWLGSLFASMGKIGLATFAVVKDLERFALLPAVAFAQVVTLLVTNDCGRHNWLGAKSNIKKILFMGSLMVFALLIILTLWPRYFVQFFDKTGDFTDLAAGVIPILSVLVFFDLLQLILSGAMRGASNVKTVMITRILVCVLYFVPCSYLISKIDFSSTVLKFALMYGSFYVGNGLMSIVYIYRFRGENWKVKDDQKR